MMRRSESGPGPHNDMIVLAESMAFAKIGTTQMMQSRANIHALIRRHRDHYERAVKAG